HLVETKMMKYLNLTHSIRGKIGDVCATSLHPRLAGATQEDLEVVGTRPACYKLVSVERKCYEGGLEGILLGPITVPTCVSPYLRNIGANASGSCLLRREKSSKKASRYLRSF
ncbi:hypothetical protein HAX54_016971, partial [Datura stramonium]|nr:hypothetical protein [Datura stramonium]